MSPKISKQEKANKRLNLYLLCSAVFLVVVVIGIIINYLNGQLNTPITITWLVGCVVYLIGMSFAIKRLKQVKDGNLQADALEPDERKEYIFGKAANLTIWWTFYILLAYISGKWYNTGEFPIDISIILLTIVILYFGHYIYYRRKY